MPPVGLDPCLELNDLRKTWPPYHASGHPTGPSHQILEPPLIPAVILYTDHQLRDIRVFCFDGQQGPVLSFDKTFNLGPMYVTVSTYRNLAINRASSGKSPAFFGPLFIHGRSDADTYNKFFARLASKLQDTTSVC